MPRPTSPTLRIIGTEYGPRFCARATALATFLGTRISTFRSSLRRARPSSLRLFWLAFRWASGALAADNRRFSARIDIIGRARWGRGSEPDGVGRGSLGGGLARLPSRGFRVGRDRRGLAPGPVSVAAVDGEFWAGARPRLAAARVVRWGGRSGAGAPAPSAGYRPGAARARAEHSGAPPHITNISDASYVALAFSVALFGDAHTRCASRPFVIAPPGPSILAAPRASVLSGWLVLVGSGALVAGNRRFSTRIDITGRARPGVGARACWRWPMLARGWVGASSCRA